MPKTFLKEMNETYLKDNDTDLNITPNNITSITKEKDDKMYGVDKYIVDTVNLNAGDDKIDQIIIKANDALGYEVYFMQKVKMRDGKEVMSEIETIFIYND